MAPGSLLRSVVQGPELPRAYRRTYARHLGYGILDAASSGILANAPLMALRGMASPDWQLGLQLAISSLGMFMVIYLGSIMAERRKMAFVVVPGMAYAACSVCMAFCQHALIFLSLLGLATLFETIARPAMTAVLRTAYPATHRGAATGEVRRWQALVFLGANLLSAWALDRSEAAPVAAIRGQLLFAATISVASFLIFRTIRMTEVGGSDRPRAGPSTVTSLRPFQDAWGIAQHDRRFRRYLWIGFLYALGGLSFVSFVPVLLSKRIGCGYVASAILLHLLPSVLSFVSTGALGRWVDGTNPWKAWTWIRLGWGIDPILLAAAGLAGPVAPLAGLALAAMGRVFRGAVMGASWILWWQVGVNHFAAPGADTTRYMGMVLFVNGLARLLGPLLGGWLLAAGSIEALMLAGGAVVLLSALLSARELGRERKDKHLATMARFEAHTNSGLGY
jgi:hypothetical protein